jgi:hypothetical protein
MRSASEAVVLGGREVTWTAGAAARMVGVPPSTLRGWHRRYDIPPAERGGRHRRYTDADIKALTRMKELIAAGVGAQSAAHAAFPPADGAGPDDVVAAALRLDTDAVISLVDGHLSVHGVIDTWEQVCAPALNRLGGPDADDVDGCVDVVHVLSWAFSVSLHRITGSGSGSRKRVLLACTAGERHVLPLEVLRAALAQRGVSAHLLGASVPDMALREAVRRTEPAPAALVLWAHGPETAHTTLVPNPATRLVLAGPGWAADERGPTSPTSLTEAVALLS